MKAMMVGAMMIVGSMVAGPVLADSELCDQISRLGASIQDARNLGASKLDAYKAVLSTGGGVSVNRLSLTVVDAIYVGMEPAELYNKCVAASE